MKQMLAILGRQPALGLAELERLYGPDAVIKTTQPSVALVNAEVDFARLGGTIKMAKLLAVIDSVKFSDMVKHLVKNLPENLHYIPEGKIRLGLSVYGVRTSVNDLNRAGLELKKVIKRAGRSVRVVPNSSLELNSAQTLHNQLTGPTGLELVLVANGSSTYLGQVMHVQDITAYAARDQARPKRDARVGMLPPKLAQIIINLSGASGTVLDPFCGTGVILQESLLMGLGAYGTDLEPRMIEYAQANLDWLGKGPAKLEVGDATDHQWSQPFQTIAAETYLGRPFSSAPDPATLKQVISDVNLIHKRFLQNLTRQTSAGFQLCLAVPAWKTQRGFEHLPLLSTLDSLTDLGYTRWSFEHVRQEDLIYHREGQIVGRELVVLTRK